MKKMRTTMNDPWVIKTLMHGKTSYLHSFQASQDKVQPFWGTYKDCLKFYDKDTAGMVVKSVDLKYYEITQDGMNDGN